MTISKNSDEPNRVAFLTSQILRPQTDQWKTSTTDGTTIRLALGADRRDDCAVFSISGEADIVFGSDYVRGTKFSLYEKGVIGNYDIGYYLVGANLSDIAAMGARPAGLLSVVRYPKNMADEEFYEIIRGIDDACQDFGIHNVGGDIGTAERVILSGSAIGIVNHGKALKRSGAKPGDVLVLGGPTGIAGAALKYFTECPQQEDIQELHESSLRTAWKRVQPQIALGQFLADKEMATACQDTSDGLKATIEQLSAASSVGFNIELAEIEIHPAVAQVADILRADVLDLVFGDSVDFRLLFTVHPDEEKISQLLSAFPDCKVIGTATAHHETVLRDNGTIRPIPGAGWRH